MWHSRSERLAIPLCIALAVAAVFSGAAVAADTDAGDGPHDSLALLTEYGVTLALSGDLAGAERAFVDLLVRSPGDARALNNLGNLHLLRGESGLALAFYERASEMDSADGGIRLNRSIAFMQRGDDESALREAALAIQEAGSLEGAASLLGLRSEEPIFKASESTTDPALTKSQLTALLKDAALAVPGNDESDVPADSTAVPAEAEPQDTRKRTWRSAGLRASDEVEVILNLYWKL